MSLNRLSKLFIIAGLVGIVIFSIGIAFPTSAAAPSCAASSSVPNVRAEIPAEFIQPVVDCDADALGGGFIPSVGPHTLRDEIPSEFVQPIMSSGED